MEKQITVLDLINATIVDLDKLTVKGAENMNLILGAIQKLAMAKQALQEAEKAHAEAEYEQADH